MEAPPAHPPPAKQSFLRRNKYVLPLLLTINVSAAAYLFLKLKEKDAEADKATPAAIPPAAPTAPLVEPSPSLAPAITEPVKPRDPIPEDQQRELFKWILEEKRKVKPKNRDEKKRIDEEKAILKQFIRSTSIPAI
uniref:Uncharacterized protein n=1 Tax=Kalanchoe fedtschenkoi TaxID=63787 RepID=A0A7N0RIQ1_KALFE